MSLDIRKQIEPRIRLLVPLAAVVILAACTGEPEVTKHARPVIAQRVAVTNTALPERYTGAVFARHQAPLSFRIGGKVVERKVGLGQQVKAGDLLARLDPVDARLAMEAADAALSAAVTQAQLARREWDRFSALKEKGGVSQAELDARKDAVELSTARMREAKKRRDMAHNQQGYTALYADRAGVITAVNTEVGQVVAAGQPAFELAHAGERELQVDIPEGRIDALRDAGAPKVSFWALSGREYVGKVREIAAEADPATRTYLVKVALSGIGPEVKLGMTGTATFQSTDRQPAIQLPLTSLFHDEEKPAVWLVDPKTDEVRLRQVEVSRYFADAVEIRAGLSVGDRVVTRGVHRLHAGQKVRPTDLDGRPV